MSDATQVPKGSLWEGPVFREYGLACEREGKLRVFIVAVTEDGECLSLIGTGSRPEYGWSGGCVRSEFEAWIARGARRIDGGDFADLREQANHNAVLAAIQRLADANHRTPGVNDRDNRMVVVVLDGDSYIVPNSLADHIDRLRERDPIAKDAIDRAIEALMEENRSDRKRADKAYAILSPLGSVGGPVATASEPTGDQGRFRVMLNDSSDEHFPDWLFQRSFETEAEATAWAEEQMKTGRFFGSEVIDATKEAGHGS